MIEHVPTSGHPLTAAAAATSGLHTEWGQKSNLL